MDWEKAAKLSRDGLRGKNPTLGLRAKWKDKQISLELREVDGRYFVNFMGRGIEVSKEEWNEIIGRNERVIKRVIDRLRRKGKPYGAHKALDPSVPLDTAMRILSEYRKGGREPHHIALAATSFEELVRLRQLAELLGWEELEREAEEAIKVWREEEVLSEKGESLVSDRWLGLRRRVRGLRKWDFYGWPKWRKKIGNVEIHGYYTPSGFKISLIVNNMRVEVKRKEDKSYARAGRREIPLGHGPHWIAYILLKNPKIAHDILETIREEGETPPEALLFHPGLTPEEKQEILKKVNWREVPRYVASPKDLDILLEQNLPEDKREEIKGIKEEIDRVYEKIRDLLSKGTPIGLIHGILAEEGWKERLGNWWMVVYSMAGALMNKEFYEFREPLGNGKRELLERTFSEYKKELEEL